MGHPRHSGQIAQPIPLTVLCEQYVGCLPVLFRKQENLLRGAVSSRCPVGRDVSGHDIHVCDGSL